eukprot:5919696-Ditylum_brightwellii.AAC.1
MDDFKNYVSSWEYGSDNRGGIAHDPCDNLHQQPHDHNGSESYTDGYDATISHHNNMCDGSKNGDNSAADSGMSYEMNYDRQVPYQQYSMDDYSQSNITSSYGVPPNGNRQVNYEQYSTGGYSQSNATQSYGVPQD